MNDEERLSRRQLLFGRSRPARDDPTDRSSPAATPATPVSTALTVIHRPPGAVGERDFLKDCTRCGDCIKACPVDAIVLADERHGRAAGTPMIRPADAPCVMCDDLPCITSCEPGVLSPSVPVRMGSAQIRDRYCLAYTGTMCTVCSERCPVEEAITVERGRPTVATDKCTGCGVCQHVCPAPYNAVVILPDTDRIDDDDDASSGGSDDSDSTPDNTTFDWRKAYFGDRSLRPDTE